MRKAVFALLFAAACNNNDNLVIGPIISSTDRTAQIGFDDLGSSIAGPANLSDANGNPVAPVLAIVLSDRPNLCDVLKGKPNYFRQPTETYSALLLFVPAERFGTFEPGRTGDEGTGSELIGGVPGKTALPFVAFDRSGFISLTPDDTASGTFNLLYGAPPELGVSGGFRYTGRFKASPCPNLASVLLP